jgi:hypothetical protein
MPEELTLKYAEDMDEKEFQRKKQMSELLLKEQELQGKQDMQMEDTKAKAEAELIKQLMEADRGRSNNPSPAEGTPEAG